MLILAHRGLHDDARENTLAAFDAAVAAGAHGIETDVRLSADGLPVLFHDPKIGRRPVARLTRAELSKAVGCHVPTLAEALERHDVFWDVEIKSKDAVDATFEVLRRYATTRRFFVTSFRTDIVHRVIRELPGTDAGRIVERAPIGPRRSPGSVVVWRFPIALRRRVRRAHLRGQRVFVYGPRTRREHERMVRAGVDGVITDRPELLRSS